MLVEKDGKSVYDEVLDEKNLLEEVIIHSGNEIMYESHSPSKYL
jgi:hypothetical protein